MMLGAQRAVLVPFRFPVFGMNLWMGSYLAAQADRGKPCPYDVNSERSGLGPARTLLLYNLNQYNLYPVLAVYCNWNY